MNLIKSVKCIFLLSCLVPLLSCSNFLSGSDIKNQISHTVDVSKIKSDTDSPVLRGVNIYKSVNGKKAGEKLSSGVYDPSHADSAYMADLKARADLYHTANLIVDFTAFEKTSGIKYVKVTQTLVDVYGGTDVSNYKSIVTKEGLYSFAVKQGESDYSFILALTPELPDGMVKVEFQLYDYFENASFDTAAFYVNKDTTADAGNLSFESGYDYDPEDPPEDIDKCFRRLNVKGFADDQWYDFGNKKYVTDSAESLTKKVYYANSGKEKKEVVIQDGEYFTIDMSSNSPMCYEIEYTDTAGGSMIYSINVPAVPSVQSYYMEDDELKVVFNAEELSALNYIHVIPVKNPGTASQVINSTKFVECSYPYLIIKNISDSDVYGLYSYGLVDDVIDGVAVYIFTPLSSQSTVSKFSAAEFVADAGAAGLPSKDEINFSINWNGPGSGTVRISAEADKSISPDNFKDAYFTVDYVTKYGFDDSIVVPVTLCTASDDPSKIVVSGDVPLSRKSMINDVYLYLCAEDFVYRVKCCSSEDWYVISSSVELPAIQFNDNSWFDDNEAGYRFDNAENKFVSYIAYNSGDAALKKNSRGKYEVTYYYVPASLGELSMEQIETYPKYVAEYDDFNDYRDIPLYGLKPGSYRVYAKIYDEAENYSFDFVRLFNNIHSGLSALKLERTGVEGRNPKFEEFNISESTSPYLCLEYYDEVNCKWVIMADINVILNAEQNEQTLLYAGNYSLDVTENRLYRIYSNTFHLIDFDTGSYYLKYLSPPAYHFSTAAAKPVCNTQLIENSGLFTVLTDQKVFVHCLSSMTDFGDNIGDWESFGEESGIEIMTSTKNYNIDLSKIQPGHYYVVVAYGIDNVPHMSKVYRKAE